MGKKNGKIIVKNFVPTKAEDKVEFYNDIVSDDELRKQIIDGTLDDPKLETTLFPNGKPSK